MMIHQEKRDWEKLKGQYDKNHTSITARGLLCRDLGGGRYLSVYSTKYFGLRGLLIVEDEPESEFKNCLH